MSIIVCLQEPPYWTDILTNYRGSALQNFFKKILEDNLKAVIKPQYVDQIPRAVKVSSFLHTVKPVSSDHIKQEIVLAIQTGGCLLLYESSFIQQ